MKQTKKGESTEFLIQAVTSSLICCISARFIMVCLKINFTWVSEQPPIQLASWQLGFVCYEK